MAAPRDRTRNITGSGMSQVTERPPSVPYEWRARVYPAAAAAVARTMRDYPYSSTSRRAYTCVLCKTCEHPGGQHRGPEAFPCRLCPCASWVIGDPGWWSDALTEELLLARRQ